MKLATLTKTFLHNNSAMSVDQDSTDLGYEAYQSIVNGINSLQHQSVFSKARKSSANASEGQKYALEMQYMSLHKLVPLQ